ncbi:MAG: NAD-dependent epimerase/dehydratase family protein [Gammaproteobacteria bacterium]|nr:NAD-dependent epimerase/dehydratase family protein [Gammaproteobacteria bacterium]
MRVLVTGATGFVGSSLVDQLVRDGIHDVRVALRRDRPSLSDQVEHVIVGEVAGETVWRQALRGIDTVIHLAARVHVMTDSVANSSAEYHRVNVDGTLNLVRQAVDADVKRIIYLSSIKVNGEETLAGQPYYADDQPSPAGSYAVSKYRAEEGIRRLISGADMSAVIIRPTLVYGAGVKGNFLNMMHWLSRGIPMPLGSIHNSRSLVALDNLVDLIIKCIEHPAAADQVFLAGDGEDLSTTELLRRLGGFLGKPARLVPFPHAVLNMIARVSGRRDVAQRLLTSLQIDIRKNWEILGWKPPVTLNQGLETVTRWYLNESRSY